MIKVPIGGETFYDVAKRKEAERLIARREQAEALREAADSDVPPGAP